MGSVRKRGRTWYFRFVDADGVKRERKGCSDRRATEELARAAESEAAKIRAGLIDPRDLARREKPKLIFCGGCPCLKTVREVRLPLPS